MPFGIPSEYFRGGFGLPDRTNEKISLRSNNMENLTHFADDEEKMRDFKILTKEEFLFSYSYLTEEEYDLTVEFLKKT